MGREKFVTKNSRLRQLFHEVWFHDSRKFFVKHFTTRLIHDILPKIHEFHESFKAEKKISEGFKIIFTYIIEIILIVFDTRNISFKIR